MNFWTAIDIPLWICGGYDIATGAQLPIDEMPAMAVTYATPPPPPAPDESPVDSAGGADGQIFFFLGGLHQKMPPPQVPARQFLSTSRPTF